MSIDRARRRFLATVTATGGAAVLGSGRERTAARTGQPSPAARPVAPGSRPAVLGGTPVRTAAFPGWPVTDTREEQALTAVVRSGRWGRGVGEQVARFEREYAALTGAAHCLATANGTSALLTAMSALGIGPGDEVIVPPYTFVATINVVLALHALPIFVDTDPDTFQIDATKIPDAITDRTRAIVPVHLGGSVADLDAVLAAAAARKVPVLEDACQAHLAEWKGRKVGTLGQAGCFSFQASKNLNSGEGGAILSNDGAFVERCYAFHNNSRGRTRSGADFSYEAPGLNLRLTEFQAAMLLAQMSRLESQSKRREANAAYLTKQLLAVPGIAPARMYAGVTRNAYHLYMFRYDPSGFGGLSRAGFLKALRAEGIPASGGYSPLTREPFLEQALGSRGYQRIYSAAELAVARERSRCPVNDRLCEQAVWLTQTMLLGPREDMDHIVDAVARIQKFGKEIAAAS
jgi:dTDP-4-amino-4,6-dideoxygalactose transaminase